MKEVSFDKKYFIETYGCQMNESDTERISGQLEELGYVPADILDDADVVILNTCSIRPVSYTHLTLPTNSLV